MKVIELCGLPGCGKSTITDHTVEELRRSGVSVASMKDVYFYSGRGIRRALALIARLIDPRNYSLNLDILRLNRRYSGKLSCLKYAFQLIMFIGNIETVQKSGKYSLALMDEGIIQYLSAQADGARISDEALCRRIIGKLSRRIPEWHVIYCMLEADDAMYRIRGRAVSSTRFAPDIEDGKLMADLECRKYNLILLTSIKCDRRIGMNTDVAKGQEALMEEALDITGGSDA